MTIQVPALHERSEDIPALVDFFLQKYCAVTKQPLKAIAPEAMEILKRYRWPGNVRELENTIERCVVLTDELELGIEDLPECVIDEALYLPETAADSVRQHHAAIAGFRRRLIQEALERAGGNQAAAARALGLQRSYLGEVHELEEQKPQKNPQPRRMIGEHSD